MRPSVHILVTQCAWSVVVFGVVAEAFGQAAAYVWQCCIISCMQLSAHVMMLSEGGGASGCW